jgi:LysM repeat protein
MSHYKVKRGDTLIQIARSYDTTVEELMRLNGLKSAKSLRAGKNIRVYSDTARTASPKTADTRTGVRTAATSQATQGAHYKVQKGDTLGQIASRHRVSVQDLMRWNGLANAKALRAGQNLRVSGGASSGASNDAPTQVAAKRSAEKQPVTQAKANNNAQPKAAYYKVQKGDTLYSIAPRYNVSVDNLMRWNDLKKATALRAGQTIRVSEGGDTNVAKSDRI